MAHNVVQLDQELQELKARVDKLEGREYPSGDTGTDVESEDTKKARAIDYLESLGYSTPTATETVNIRGADAVLADDPAKENL